MSDEEDTTAEVITPPNRLKGKVVMGGPGAIDPDVLEKAEQVIAEMADDYIHWAREDIGKLASAFDELAADPSEEKLDAVFQIAHDMKGQGGSFGYDLVTAIGHELCRFIEKVEEKGEIGARQVDAVKVHVDAIKRVINDDMKGDGGEQGTQLLTGLQLVRQKLFKE
jgi:chemotaxis protein histidine kinase CheA